MAFPSTSNDGEDLLDDPMAFKASTDPDIMYIHEAMREKDKQKFIEAMEKEAEEKMNNGNFTIVKKSEVPEGKVILPAVWQMRNKDTNGKEVQGMSKYRRITNEKRRAL